MILLVMTCQVHVGFKLESYEASFLQKTEKTEKGVEEKDCKELFLNTLIARHAFDESRKFVMHSTDPGLHPIVEYSTPPPDRFASRN